jgi:Flp pilus assembly protein TadG
MRAHLKSGIAHLTSVYRRPGEQGASLVEFALVLPFFLALFLGAIEFGRLFYIAAEVTTAAQAGALYGTQNPSDVSGMKAAAQQGASNLTGLNAAATYGCECSDGTNSTPSCTATPSCSYNYVTYIDVTTSASYVPIFRYPGIPATMTIVREFRMRVGGD